MGSGPRFITSFWHPVLTLLWGKTSPFSSTGGAGEAFCTGSNPQRGDGIVCPGRPWAVTYSLNAGVDQQILTTPGHDAGLAEIAQVLFFVCFDLVRMERRQLWLREATIRGRKQRGNVE